MYSATCLGFPVYLEKIWRFLWE